MASWGKVVFVIILLVFITGCDNEDLDILETAERALRENDPGVCEDKYPASNEVEEKEKCYSKMATLSNNTDTCKLITEEERNMQCYTDVAVQTMSMGVCNDIEYDSDKAKCVALVTAEIAGKMASDMADGIETNYDRLFGEASACEKLYPEGERQGCYNRSASRYGNAEYCDKVGDGDDRDSCLSEAGVANGDNNICKEIKNELSKNFCTSEVLLNYAVNSDDAKLCDKAPTQFNKDWCLERYAIARMKPTVCQQISDPGRKSSCIQMIDRKWAKEGKETNTE